MLTDEIWQAFWHEENTTKVAGSTHLRHVQNDNFIKMQMGITMAHGISLSLCKDNYMEVANVVLNDLFHTDLFLE